MAIICVSGATGNVGGACARYLLSLGAKVRCLVRDADSEKSLALKALGAELAPGDFANAESLSAALKGTVAAMLACSNQPEQVALETNFIRAVESSSTCKYLVKLSTCGCQRVTVLQTAQLSMGAGMLPSRRRWKQRTPLNGQSYSRTISCKTTLATSSARCPTKPSHIRGLLSR